MNTPQEMPEEPVVAQCCMPDGIKDFADKQEMALKRILAAHKAYFDVYQEYEFAGKVFPGYAEFHSQASQYVLVKRAKLWEVNAYEYMFIDFADCLNAALLNEELDFITTRGIEKVQPGPEHMTSYLSLIIVACGVEEGLDRLIRKTRFRKNFKFSIFGWADLRLAVVDLARGVVLTNAQGKELQKTLEDNAFGAHS